MPVTLDEIKDILLHFKKERSPGPDGWTTEFFIHFFELAGEDLLKMVEDSRLKGKIAGGLNSTFLVLIPKENNPHSFNDFRPIALCNLVYKVIAKVISNRIKPFLAFSLSERQLGFLKGRRIQDAIGAAHECIHSTKQKNQKALILKLDLKKAFDCIDWEFLRLILHAAGFGALLTNWILACVTNANFAVLINGEASSFFKSERGLRQGCPLSPYLFILIMEGLSLLLNKRFIENHISGIKVSKLVKIFLLMFVDDVLIMTKADLVEWTTIQDSLLHFCSVSGLSINHSKSYAHHWGLSASDLLRFKDFFTYTFIDLKEGFRYLGYQLKMGATHLGDWRWLVAIFEKKIDFWCNKWLSMGGRFILIKAVLESLVVFWMTLERIPNKITSLLRRLAFNFLWNGRAGNRRIHLCSWETLSKPRRVGGWGLKNLHTFNTALLASSWWRAVTKDSIWHRIIIDKYLGSLPLCHWIRRTSLQTKRASPIWKGLVASTPVILHWLRWKPSTGMEIIIGKDKIIGLEERSLLSSSLCAHLSTLNIMTLSDVRMNGVTALPDHWLGSSELALVGSWAEEWNCYIIALRSAGITLSTEPDSLLWAGGDATGTLSVKNLYAAIQLLSVHSLDSSWYFQLWKWTVPLKIKLFLWLAGKAKILTWDGLRRRGWEGPGICLLYRCSSEDVQHLLIHCEFAREVWSRLLLHLNLPFNWNRETLSDCFQLWVNQKTPPVGLAAIVCWQLWLERNRVTFEDRPPNLQSVVHKVLYSFHWTQAPEVYHLHKAVEINLPVGYTLAYFDGAEQAGCCGAGGFFKSNQTGITKWYFSCGRGTNTKAELLALWSTLYLATSWSVKHLIVLGDSRVVIDWINCKSNLRSVHIECWKQKTLVLSKLFEDVKFQHVQRSHNGEADALSKRALKEEVGYLSIFHSDDGVDSPSTHLSIF